MMDGMVRPFANVAQTAFLAAISPLPMGNRPSALRNRRPLSDPARADHRGCMWDPTTMNSVSREPQLPQRHFICTSGTSPRPATISAARSASFAWRDDLHHARTRKMLLGAFIAGAIVRAALDRRHDEAVSARFDGLGSAFVVPIFFVTSGVRLDVASLLSYTVALMMVPLYAVLMLVARGLPALVFYRTDLSLSQRIGLALHSGTQLSLVLAITGIAMHRGLMPGEQGAALVGGGILTTIFYPAFARRFLQQEPAHPAFRVRVDPRWPISRR